MTELPFSQAYVRPYIGHVRISRTSSIDWYLAEKTQAEQPAEQHPTRIEQKRAEATTRKITRRQRFKKALTAATLFLTGGGMLGTINSDTPGNVSASHSITTPLHRGEPSHPNPTQGNQTPPECTSIQLTTTYQAPQSEYAWNIAKKIVSAEKHHKITPADIPDVNIISKMITEENKNNPQLRDGVDQGDILTVPSPEAASVVIAFRQSPGTSPSDSEKRLYTELNRLNHLSEGAQQTQESLLQQIGQDIQKKLQQDCYRGRHRAE